jgi:hypothetical protein
MDRHHLGVAEACTAGYIVFQAVGVVVTQRAWRKQARRLAQAATIQSYSSS